MQPRSWRRLNTHFTYLLRVILSIKRTLTHSLADTGCMLRNNKTFSPYYVPSTKVIEIPSDPKTLLIEGLSEQERAFKIADTDEVVPLKTYIFPSRQPVPLNTWPLSNLMSVPALPSLASKRTRLATLVAALPAKPLRNLKKRAKYQETWGERRQGVLKASGSATKIHAHKHIAAAKLSATLVAPVANVIPGGCWSGIRTPYSPKVYSSTEILSISGLTLIKANG